MNDTNQDVVGLYSSWVVRSFRLLTSLAVAGMGIILNSISITVLSKGENKCFGEITTIFIGALAWKDLISAIQLFFTEVLILLTPLPMVWDGFCLLLTVIFYNGVNLSALFLCCLSIDRYVAILYPLRYPVLLTKRIALRMLLVAGHVGTLSCVAMFSYHHLKGYGHTRFDFGIYFCRTDWSQQFQDPIWIAISSLGFLVPVVSFMLITVVNAKLFTTALGHVRRRNQISTSLHRRHHVTVRDQLSSLMEMKALRSLLVITICFYVSYGPIFVDTVLQFLASNRPLFARFLITYYFTYNNCWMNCLVYVFMYKQFRKETKRHLKAIFRKSDSVTDIMT